MFSEYLTESKVYQMYSRSRLRDSTSTCTPVDKIARTSISLFAFPVTKTNTIANMTYCKPTFKREETHTQGLCRHDANESRTTGQSERVAFWDSRLQLEFLVAESFQRANSKQVCDNPNYSIG